MKISDMLTPEERELARLLGRPAAGEQPGAELDARIMAMAQKPQPSAVAAPPRPARNPGWSRRRAMTSSLAIAASLVLVVGLAWQLRPTSPPAPDLSTAPAVAPAAAPQAEAAVDAANVAGPAAPAAAMDEKAPGGKSAATPVPAKASASKTAAPRAASAHDAEAVAAAAIEATQIVTPPSPPAPPAPPPAMASQPGEYAGAQADRHIAPQAPPAARMAAPRPEPLTAIRSSGSTPQSASNPAAERLQQDIEHDAALSRRQWLKRIRERRDSGDLSGARLSLQRFMQEYPEARIPRDLRPLLTD